MTISMRTKCITQLGNAIPNGCTLVDFRTLNNREEAITLWVRPDNPHHPYVVWRSYFDGDSGKMVHEHGSYCSHLTEAVEAMNERCADLYQEPKGELPTYTSFNTGRHYSKEGQRIVMGQKGPFVYFHDIDRSIDGYFVMPHSNILSQEGLMGVYDNNEFMSSWQMVIGLDLPDAHTLKNNVQKIIDAMLEGVGSNISN